MTLLKSVSLDDVAARGAITDADVLRMRRAFYADGRIEPHEAEALIALNAACREQAPAWIDCYVEMLTDHLVNQVVPEGYLTVENADWLIERVTRNGRIATRGDFELVVNVLDKARWSPERLVAFALAQVRDVVLERNRDLTAPTNRPIVCEADVELLRRIIYAFGGDANIAITRAEADILFEINDATEGAENADAWQPLFVKAIANCVLSASGYVMPSREEALAREAWLDRRGDLSLGNMLAGMANGLFGGYRKQSKEEQAISRLERQKIEIVTGEGVSPAEAAWLAERIGRNGSLGTNEQALLAMLRDGAPDLHPDLAGLLSRLPAAA
jgi:hypothetical protein